MSEKQDYMKFRYEWHRIKQTRPPVMFDSLRDFVEWCRNSYYVDGYRLCRKDPKGPWAPDNMEWCESKLSPITVRNREEMGKQWDDFIKTIKKPVIVEKKPEVFRYEHPDLVREGIVFESSRRV